MAIEDGMVITVVRVEEETRCENVEIPYDTKEIPVEGLEPGTKRIAQEGILGVRQVCYRIIIEDGEEIDSKLMSSNVLEEAQDELIWVGIKAEIEPLPIEGTLAYISHNNAWIIRDNAIDKRAVTSGGGLDGKVFELSPDGRRLLYTRPADSPEGAFNELWLINDVRAALPEPAQLPPENVLYAGWVPNTDEVTFTYSTAEPQSTEPGWRAYNDLWTLSLDPQTGSVDRVEDLIPANDGGFSGWWGTDFWWSPDGKRLAWSRADSVGLIDFADAAKGGGAFDPLITFVPVDTYGAWAWNPTVSWSADGRFLLTTVLAPPPEAESPGRSTIFNIIAASISGDIRLPIFEETGIWAAPAFSPVRTLPAGDDTDDDVRVEGHMVYFQARDPLNSRTSDYDLVIADRDGSNARVLFPDPDKPGLRPTEREDEIAWSPDGLQIALIYRGNLYVIDVATGQRHQITVDGGASSPRWTE
jgi:hypothetical protein